MIRRVFAGAAIVAGAVAAGGGGPVSAHAELIASSPADGAALDAAPEQISITFTEAVDPVPESIRLLDGDGETVAVGDVDQAAGDDTVTAPVDSLPDGSYVVAWKAVSADSHPISGAYTFTVADAAPADPGLVDQVLLDGDGGGSDRWLGAGRFLSYTGIAVLVGVLVVAGRLAPAALGSRRSGLVLGLALDAALIGTVIMIAAQSAWFASSAFAPVGWRQVIDTRAGRWWLARLGALIPFAVIILARRTLLRRRLGHAIVAVAAVALLVVVAAGGHATTGRAVALGALATVVHLAAMAVWVGGLLTVVIIVAAGDRWQAATRFSPVALGSVVVLAATGTINALRQGALGGLTDTSYGRWLLVKLAVLVVVVAVAATNRRLLRADSSPSSVKMLTGAGTVGAAGTSGDRTRRVRRAVAVETAGIAVVLAATAGLVNSPPPTAAASAAEPAAATITVTRDGVSALITVDPAVTGGTLMHVTLTSTNPTFAVPDEIRVEASLPSRDLGPIDIPTVAAGDQHVIASDAVFPVAGTWTVTVTARYGDFDQLVFDAEVTVR